MSDIEEIKKRKMEQLKAQYQSQMQQQLQDQLQQQMQVEQQIEALEQVVKAHLDKDALTRYGNIKAANPQKAVQILVILGQAIQAGHIRTMLNDEQFKAILEKLTPEKKEFKIRRK